MFTLKKRAYITLSNVDANPLVVLQSKAIRNQPFGKKHITASATTLNRLHPVCMSIVADCK